MFTMLPRRCATITSPASLDRCQIAVRLTSMAFRKTSSDSSSMLTVCPTPGVVHEDIDRAVLIDDLADRAARGRAPRTRRTRSRSVPGRSPASASSRSFRRAATTTVAPAAWSTRANRSPRPDDAPVTRATRPSSRKSAERSIVSVTRGTLRALSDQVGGSDACPHRLVMQITDPWGVDDEDWAMRVTAEFDTTRVSTEGFVCAVSRPPRVDWRARSAAPSTASQVSRPCCSSRALP